MPSAKRNVSVCGRLCGCLNRIRCRRPASGSARHIRWAPRTTGPARTSRCSRVSPTVSSCACSATHRPTDGATRSASTSQRSTGTSGTSTCPMSVPGSATATACTAPGTRSRGCGATRAKLLLDPYAKAIEGEIDWDRRPASATSSTTPTSRTSTTARPTCRMAVVERPLLRLGQRPPARAHRARVRHLRGPREGSHDAPSRRRPRSCVARTPASRTRRSSSTSPSSGSPAIELMPVHQFIHDHHLRRAGLRNYWGYNSIAFLAPHNELQRTWRRSVPSRSSRRWSRHCTRPGSR